MTTTSTVHSSLFAGYNANPTLGYDLEQAITSAIAQATTASAAASAAAASASVAAAGVSTISAAAASGLAAVNSASTTAQASIASSLSGYLPLSGGTISGSLTAPLLNATVTPTGGLLATKLETVIADVDLLRAFGFVGKGVGTTLASQYGTLAAARAVYPHAVALTDTFDWAAIQGLYNAAVTAGASGFALTLPAGDAVLSRPVATGALNVAVRGAGQEVTRLLMQSGGTGAWVHGTAGTPAIGYFQLEDVTVTDGNSSGSGSTGLAIYFSGSVAQPCLTLHTVAFRKWTAAISITNAPRGVHVENVTVYGPDFTIQTGAGIAITSTTAVTGCYSYTFINVMVVNYTWGWAYTLGQKLEGQVFKSCRAYSGWGLVRVVNSVGGGYRSLLWDFTSCDWQGLGFALDMGSCRKVVIRGGYWIANLNGSSLSNPNGASRRRYFQFLNCLDVDTTAMQIDVLPSQDTGLSLIYCDATCARIKFRDTGIYSLSTIYAGFEWDTNSNSNVIADLDTKWATWTGGTKVLDSGANQTAQSLVRAIFAGDCSAQGEWRLHGVTGSVTTDVNGEIAITFPTRDGTHPFFIGSAPHLIVSSQNGSANVAVPSIKTISTTGFTVKFAGGAGLTVQIQWTAQGL